MVEPILWASGVVDPGIVKQGAGAGGAGIVKLEFDLGGRGDRITGGISQTALERELTARTNRS